MILSRIPLLAVLCLLSLAPALFGQGAQPSYLFQINPPSGSTQTVNVYSPTAPTFSQLVAPGVPLGTVKILPKYDGTKVYYLASNGAFVSDINFSNIRNIGNLPSPATAGVFSAQGEVLIVGAGRLYFFDTISDTVINAGGAAINGNIVDMVLSLNGRRVFVLSVTGSESYLTTFDVNTRQPLNTAVQLPGDATGLAIAPNNRLYVTARSRVYEINAETLQLTQGGEIGVVGRPVSPTVTSDGRYLVLVNSTPLIGGASVYSLDLNTRTLSQWPAQGATNSAPLFDSLYRVANNKLLVYSQSGQSYFDVAVAPLNVTESTLQVITNTRNVNAMAVSNEVPTPRYVFLLSSSGQTTILQRVDLQANNTAGQVQNVNPQATLQFFGLPAVNNPATVQTFNQPATIAGGTAGIPLVARVLDNTGRPVRNVTVTFSADGVVFSSATAVTTGEGYAVTSFTAPAASGALTINASVPGVPVAGVFNYTVQGTSGGGGGGTNPGGIFIVEGNGQLVQERNPAGRQMKVLVLDAQGKPVPNEEVRFDVVSGRGGILGPVQLTDAQGFASAGFQADVVDFAYAFQPTTVRASSSRGSVDFYLTTFLLTNISGNSAPPPLVELLNPSQENGRLITGRAGETIVGGIQALITAVSIPQQGAGIPNVGVRIENVDNPDAPAPARCGNQNPLSDGAGNLKCDLVIGCTVGQTNIAIIVGEYRRFSGLLRVTAGSASKLTALAGNNQTGQAGQTLPTTLLAQVTDGCGSPLSGVQVQWSVTQGSATLTQVVSTSDSQGRVSARVQLGTTPGAVQIRVRIPAANGGSPVDLNFLATINVSVSGVTATAGQDQVGFVNQAFGQQLEVQVRDTNNQPLPNFPVTFAVTSGSASVNPASSNTDSNGRARTTVTAGATAGPIVVTATSGTFSATFNLTSRIPGPSIGVASFINAASGAPGLTPCGLASVFGAGLATGVNGVVLGSLGPGPLPLNLSGVGLTVNGFQAPILSVSNVSGREQVNFQVPCEVTPGPATVVVTVNNGTPTTVSNVPLTAAQPGVFEFTATNGRRYAAVLRPDGSYVTPDNPARTGETLKLITTGLGLVNPASGTNRVGIGGQLVPLNIILGLNGAGVRVINGEYSQLGVGLYAISFEVPASGQIDAGAGQAPISVTGTNVPISVAVVLPTNETVFSNSSFVSIVPR